MAFTKYFLIFTGLVLLQPTLAQQNDVQSIKSEILNLASSFQGQGDPDGTKQHQLNRLVRNLLRAAPQPSAYERRQLIAGVWRQVWGSYDYRNDGRGVDPELGTDEIYQVISPKGYYYNVSYSYRNGDRSNERIGLLRGEYKFERKTKNALRVRFTDFPGVDRRIPGRQIWELAELAETNQLDHRITIVPSWLVRLFFSSGTLREVYTDENLRITYGSKGKKMENEFIYIMTRVDTNPVTSLKR